MKQVVLNIRPDLFDVSVNGSNIEYVNGETISVADGSRLDFDVKVETGTFIYFGEEKSSYFWIDDIRLKWFPYLKHKTSMFVSIENDIENIELVKTGHNISKKAYYIVKSNCSIDGSISGKLVQNSSINLGYFNDPKSNLGYTVEVLNNNSEIDRNGYLPIFGKDLVIIRPKKGFKFSIYEDSEEWTSYQTTFTYYTQSQLYRVNDSGSLDYGRWGVISGIPDYDGCLFIAFAYKAKEDTSQSMYLSCATEQMAKDVLGLNNLYLVDKEQLKRISTARFKKSIIGGSQVETTLDYGNMILNLVKIPYKYDDELVGEVENVVLGDLDTSVGANAFLSDYLNVDFGKVKIEKSEYLDGMATTYMLRLPFTDSIAIEHEYVLKGISVNYRINLYNGNADVYITADGVGVVAQKNVHLGINVPLANISDEPRIYNPSNSGDGFNDILKPFLEVVKVEPYMIDGFFNIPILDECLLGEVSGYCKIDDFGGVNFGTLREREDLSFILKSGVIFND